MDIFREILGSEQNWVTDRDIGGYSIYHLPPIYLAFAIISVPH